MSAGGTIALVAAAVTILASIIGAVIKYMRIYGDVLIRLNALDVRLEELRDTTKTLLSWALSHSAEKE